MKKCVFAGSFDPITKGHMEIIEKASKLFDEVVVGLLYNQDKKYTFSAKVRSQAVTDACAKIKNVTVKSFDGRLVDFLKQENAVYFVRGLRNEKDYKYEERIRRINKSFYPDIEYVYLCSDKNVQISSTLVKTKLASGEDVSELVPIEAIKYLKN